MFRCCRGKKEEGGDAPEDLGSSYALSKLASSSATLKWEEEKRTGVRISPEVQLMVDRICDEGAMLDQQWEYVQKNEGNIPIEILVEVDEEATSAIGMLWTASANLHSQVDETILQLKARCPDILTTTDSFWLATRERALRDMIPDLVKTEKLLAEAKRTYLVDWKRPPATEEEVSSFYNPVERFSKLQPAAAPGGRTMQWVIGALVLRAETAAGLGTSDASKQLQEFQVVYENARIEFFGKLPGSDREEIVSRLEAYEVSRTQKTTEYVPKVLADVAKYSSALRLALKVAEKLNEKAGGATPTLRLRNLVNDSDAKQRFLFKGESLAMSKENTALVLEDDDAPPAKSLARIVYDRRVGASVSIKLYCVVSEISESVDASSKTRPGPPKQVRRTIFKSCSSYGGDTTRCRDKARVTVEVVGLAAAADVAEALVESKKIVCARWKNRFDPDYDAIAIGGYRDLQLLGLIEMDGRYHYVEVQINIKPMLDIKAGIGGAGGHSAFNVARALDGTSPRQLRFTGMPSESVWSRISAGMLLEITLDGFELTDEQCQGLLSATKSPKCRLRKLSVVTCGLVGERGGKFAGKVIKSLAGLDQLNLYNNALGPLGMKHVAPALKTMKNWRECTQLNIGKTGMGEDGAKMFLPALKSITSVNNFDLSDNALETHGTKVLASAVGALGETLEWFNLENNRFGNGGAAAIAPALKRLTKMLGIFLYGNKLGGAGMNHLAAGLKMMPKLIMLHLGVNQLGVDGMKALVPVFEACQKLNSVDLQDNELTADAFEVIGPSLSALQELGDLRVANNQLGADGDKGARSLIPIVKSLPKLHTLYCEDNDVSPEVQTLIKEAVAEGCVVHF